MATIKERKADLVRKKNVNPLDNARNPNFDAAMAQRNYANSMAQERARMEAGRGQFTEGRLMGAPTDQPIPPGGGLGGLTADQAGISPEQRKTLDDLMAQQANQPIPPSGGMGGLTADQAGIPADQGKILDDLMATRQGGNMAGIPMDGQPIRLNSAMGQMKDYNKILQQGMQRNQDMNQAVQNFAAPAAPQKSFSQVGSGMKRMFRSFNQPRQNSISPSNQKLI
jgi:hypothetical protein